VALAALGALPALGEDREGELEEQGGSTKHLAMPSDRPLGSGAAPGSGERALSPRQRGGKAAQDGKKGKAELFPSSRHFGKGTCPRCVDLSKKK